MTKTELVFVPFPAMGHLFSMVEFAELIVQTNSNISIIIVLYHMSTFEPTQVTDYNDSQSRLVDSAQITFVTLPPLLNQPDPSSPDFFGPLRNPLLMQVIKDHKVRPDAFVLDHMNVSMIDVANELHVPSYIYYIAGANLLDIVFHFQAIAEEKGTDDITKLVSDAEVELNIPGFRNRVTPNVLPWEIHVKDNIWSWLIINGARRLREAKGILVNTFMEFESSVIQALQEKGTNIPNIYPVGPILSLNNNGTTKASNIDNDIMSWLDAQPQYSVVFLCFGSMGSFDADQVKEIADGLDRSGHRFLWSLRKPYQVGTLGVLPSEEEIFEDALPKGFLDRTSNRGKIVSWVPQVSILAHKAIGGFVSHCWWNSILESIWFGVPIATWPMFAESQLNAFTLVKELGLAVEIRLDYRWDFLKQKRNFLVTAEEVNNSVRKLMGIDKKMRKMRGKVSELSDKSRKVLEDGGSSYYWLTRFIGEVKKKV